LHIIIDLKNKDCEILKSLTLLVGLACIAMNASAQTKSTMTSEQMAQKETDKVKMNVTGVTSDQESKIWVVEEKHSKACEEAKTAANGDKDAFKSKKKQLCETRDEKMKAILTTNQYVQYAKMEKADKKASN
jgi:hypothetical protein